MLELMHREAPQIGFAHSLPQLLDRQRSFVLTNRQFLFARQRTSQPESRFDSLQLLKEQFPDNIAKGRFCAQMRAGSNERIESTVIAFQLRSIVHQACRDSRTQVEREVSERASANSAEGGPHPFRW